MSTTATRARLLLCLFVGTITSCKPADEPLRIRAEGRDRALDADAPQLAPVKPRSPGLVRLVAAEPVQPAMAQLPPLTQSQSALAKSALYQRLDITSKDIQGLGALLEEEEREAAELDLSRGLEALKQGQRDRALQFLDRVLSISPGNAQARLERARASLANDQRADALRHLALLKALTSPVAPPLLASALEDMDFRSLFTDPDFIELTEAQPIVVRWPEDSSHLTSVDEVMRRLRAVKLHAVRGQPTTTSPARTSLYLRASETNPQKLSEAIRGALKFTPTLLNDPPGPAPLTTLLLTNAYLANVEDNASIARFFGHVLNSRDGDKSERLKLNATGFFSWETLHKDGTEIRRSGRFHLAKSRLALDFKQTTERPSSTPGQRDVEVEQGRRESFDVRAQGEGIVVGPYAFTLASPMSP